MAHAVAQGEILVSLESNLNPEAALTFDIEDLNPDNLVTGFGLDSVPKIIIAVAKKKVVAMKDRHKLVPGSHYYIPDSQAKATSRDPTPKPDDAGDARAGSSLFAHLAPRPSSSRTSPWEFTGPPWGELAQNAAIVSKAVYEDTDYACQKYLLDNLHDHNFARLTRSRHGRCQFLIAEEAESNGKVYISFRGTHNTGDWQDNLKAHQIEGAARCKVIKGKFHSGFLARAVAFPIEVILADKSYAGKEFVLCGHSLGGAVATIVAILLLLEIQRRQQAGVDQGVTRVRCITFGAPLVGNEDLRTFCNEAGISERLFHFVCDEDPVPRLLSYAHFLSALSNQLDNQVRALMTTYATREGASFYEEKRQRFIDDKNRYVQSLSKITPILEPMLDFASYACPKYAIPFVIARHATSVLGDVVYAAKSNEKGSRKNAYVPIGNYLFLRGRDEHSEIPQSGVKLTFQQEEMITRCLEMPVNRCLSDTAAQTNVFHSVNSYIEFVGDWGGYGGTFPAFTTAEALTYGGHTVLDTFPRKIDLTNKYMPKILTAELVRVETLNTDILRLRLTGNFLHSYVLDSCQFNFGFPFGRKEEKVTIRKMPTGSDIERLLFEEDYSGESPSISDHGALIVLATQFGECEYLIQKNQLRNIRLASVHQISHHESVSVLVRRAVQRGMSISQIRRKFQGDRWRPADEQVIQEVLKLATLALAKTDFEALTQFFDDTSKNVQFIFSNEEEFEKVRRFCTKIQEYLRSPLRIDAPKSVAKKIGIGVATLVGGALLAYAAGPGLVFIGVVEAISLPAAGFAGAVGSVSAGIASNLLLTDKLVDDNYEQVLVWITQELFQRLESGGGPSQDEIQEKRDKLQQISDLREDGRAFSLEKALLLLYDGTKGIENFKGSDLAKCDMKTQLDVIKRIECIRTIHNIREILSRQCYIGVVGIQDSGKTTLLNKIWGVSGQTGYFSHTDVPTIYEVDRRLFVVDFPGSNSLDYHAKTFSICGAMNNMIIVVVPYTGDISRLLGEELSRVFGVMAGSDSTHILLCVNKCGYELPRAIREELSGQDDPIDYLRARFAGRLNDFYQTSGQNISISKENILFTDWFLDDDSEEHKMGIQGVNRIKEEIKRYLLKNNVVEEAEIPDMFNRVLQ